MAIPKLRQGSYFPDWLLERRRRAEAALVTVEAFRTRPLDAGRYPFLAADAMVLKVREGGRTINVHALIAVGVNAEGYRRSSACRSAPPRTAPAGWPSSVT